jgi:subfamily B ATP-binding cassette protein MsbA
MSLYRRLLELVKPYWFKLALAMICMVFVSFLTAAQAFLVKPALDGVFLNKAIEIPPLLKNIIIQLHLENLLLIKDREMLRLLPIAIIFLFLLKGIFNYAQAYLMNYVGLKTIADIREKLYNSLLKPPLEFLSPGSRMMLP